jgi:plasmid stability protein
MSKMMQIRNVPDTLHRILKVRAAKSGMSLSDYLLRELRHVAEVPTIEEIQERLRQHGTVTLPAPAAELVRQERETR